MSYIIFNREIKKLILVGNHPMLEYINKKYLENKKYKNYYAFFDTYLIGYGILTLDYKSSPNGIKYIPYINCKSKNIFREEKGVHNLSKKAVGKIESQIILAHYLIEQLKFLNIYILENWDFDANIE